MQGNGFYSCRWAKDENGDLAAIVVDFACSTMMRC